MNFKLCLACLILILPSVALSDEEVSLDRRMSGKIADNALKTVIPKNGMVTGTQAWRQLSAAWRPDKPFLAVDFDKQLVIVETVDGPNNMFVNQMMLDEQGNLKFDVASTRLAGPGFAYLVLIVPKKGIRSVNGKPVPQAKVALPDPDTRSAVKESVKVDVTGQIRIGVISIGGETTGARISANGIMMDLDFQNDEQLIEAARHLSASAARVKGQLTKVAGVEAADRWVVKVESLTPINGQTVTRSETTSAPPQVTVVEPRPVNRTEPKAPAFKPSFKSIRIDTTGGLIGANQKQLIRADGHVTQDVNNQRADEWDMDGTSLALLHQLVGNTNWKTVPRLTRTPNAADAFNYTITIDRPRGMTRLFIDSPGISKQPVIKNLMILLRKPKTQPNR